MQARLVYLGPSWIGDTFSRGVKYILVNIMIKLTELCHWLLYVSVLFFKVTCERIVLRKSKKIAFESREMSKFSGALPLDPAPTRRALGLCPRPRSCGRLRPQGRTVGTPLHLWITEYNPHTKSRVCVCVFF